MKKRVKALLGFLCFVVSIVACLHISSRIFIPKWNRNKDAYMTSTMENFYKEKKNSLDVLFLGDSSLYRSMNPSLLWNNKKITSYVYGSPNQRAWLSYYLLKEALQYQKPKVVVIEANELLAKGSSSVSSYRKVLDNMKFGQVKFDAMNDTAFKFNFGDKMSLLFPIFQYHNRYNELTWDDVKYAFGNSRDYNRKGYAINASFRPYKGKANYMGIKDKKEPKISKETAFYMDKIFELCKDNNIRLALIKVPNATEWNEERSLLVKKWGAVRNIPVLELNRKGNDVINWHRDTPDKGIHLNLFGAEKVTTRVGDFLTKNFTFDRIRDPEVIKSFNLSYKEYEQDKKIMIEKLKQHKNGKKFKGTI